MNLSGISAVVTGGVGGLGLATASLLVARGASVVITDLPSSAGAEAATQLGERAQFVPADVTDENQLDAAFETAHAQAPVRALVHCAGGSLGNRVRVVDRDGAPGSLDRFAQVVHLNVVGTFNALRLAAARMAVNAPRDGDRGVCVLTASVAAFEGQIGQIPYAASKAGVVGMTLVAARDLASRQIRVCSIAPGPFASPAMKRRPEEFLAALAAAIPHPSRLGQPEEFAALAAHVIENPFLNGETIRLDGAIRMPAR
jgi:NAD(P)-dependent dehydrogenase (short-subunit alcohol dehydrogenase family)